MPPPWTTTADKPSLFITEISSMNWSNKFFSRRTDPPHFITIMSLEYLLIYFFTSSMDGPFLGSIFLIPFIE